MDINKSKNINVSSDNKILSDNNNEKNPNNDIKDIKIFLKSIYNKYPEESKIRSLKASNCINIGTDEYVEYDKKSYPNKYNDIYNFLTDNTFVPIRYRTTHKNKHIANKRKAFRKYARENYYINDNRLYFKYKRYKNKCLNVKIPFKGEVYPILKYIHINNNHIVYKNMCNQILLSEFYWLGYSQDITNFLNKCEICLSNKKKNHIIPPLKIIIEEGPKFRYIVDLWEIPQDLSINTDYIY